jgi:hypothetical protein
MTAELPAGLLHRYQRYLNDRHPFSFSLRVWQHQSVCVLVVVALPGIRVVVCCYAGLDPSAIAATDG